MDSVKFPTQSTAAKRRPKRAVSVEAGAADLLRHLKEVILCHPGERSAVFSSPVLGANLKANAGIATTGRLLARRQSRS